MPKEWTRNEKIALASLFATIVGTIATITTIPGAREWLISNRVGAPSVSAASVLPITSRQPLRIEEEKLRRLCTVRLNRDGLVQMTPVELEILRNSIYALHGRPFARKDLRAIFGAQSWYRANTGYTDASLTSIDWYNIELIREAEKAGGGGGA